MPYATKVQLINRKHSQQYYVNFPTGLAQAMDLGKSEPVCWSVRDRSTLILERPEAPPSALRKTSASSKKS